MVHLYVERVANIYIEFYTQLCSSPQLYRVFFFFYSILQLIVLVLWPATLFWFTLMALITIFTYAAGCCFQQKTLINPLYTTSSAPNTRQS